MNFKVIPVRNPQSDLDKEAVRRLHDALTLAGYAIYEMEYADFSVMILEMTLKEKLHCRDSEKDE